LIDTLFPSFQGLVYYHPFSEFFSSECKDPVIQDHESGLHASEDKTCAPPLCKVVDSLSDEVVAIPT